MISAVPALTPVTTPPDTVATSVLLLLHVPHVDDVLNKPVAPTHIAVVPEGVDGTGFTIISRVLEQAKEPVLVNVIVTLPAEIPVTSPDVEPMVAIDVLLLVHD